MKIQLKIFIQNILLILLTANIASAHEPVFSLGPETIFKNGVGIETEFEFEQADKNKDQVMHTEILYGLTESIGLTLEIPQFLDKKETLNSSDGLGDIALRTKYQFYKKDALGSQNKATLIYGIKFPSGNHNKNPPLGSNSVDHLFGLSIGHESTKLYGFATGRYLLKTDSKNNNNGDQLLLDFSVGFRPKIRAYKSWDFVFLLENSYIYTQKNKISGTKISNSGGQQFFIGPSALISMRNIMFKAGVQFPVWQDLNGAQSLTDLRSIAAIEYHF